MAATTSAAAAAVFSLRQQPTLHANTRAPFVSFPRRSPPTAATLLALSVPAPPSARRQVAPAANPKYHNAKADAGDEDVNGEELLRVFTREVARAGVMEEIRRRRRHEDARDRRKRKARSAARRYRRRHFKGPYPFDDVQEAKEHDDDKNDNWELPGGKLPSYR